MAQNGVKMNDRYVDGFMLAVYTIKGGVTARN
jgi:hypothetical protein